MSKILKSIVKGFKSIGRAVKKIVKKVLPIIAVAALVYFGGAYLMTAFSTTAATAATAAAGSSTGIGSAFAWANAAWGSGISTAATGIKSALGFASAGPEQAAISAASSATTGGTAAVTEAGLDAFAVTEKAFESGSLFGGGTADLAAAASQSAPAGSVVSKVAGVAKDAAKGLMSNDLVKLGMFNTLAGIPGQLAAEQQYKDSRKWAGAFYGVTGDGKTPTIDAYQRGPAGVNPQALPVQTAQVAAPAVVAPSVPAPVAAPGTTVAPQGLLAQPQPVQVAAAGQVDYAQQLGPQKPVVPKPSPIEVIPYI